MLFAQSNATTVLTKKTAAIRVRFFYFITEDDFEVNIVVSVRGYIVCYEAAAWNFGAKSVQEGD